jgi:hypothetical protein
LFASFVAEKNIYQPMRLEQRVSSPKFSFPVIGKLIGSKGLEDSERRPAPM